MSDDPRVLTAARSKKNSVRRFATDVVIISLEYGIVALAAIALEFFSRGLVAIHWLEPVTLKQLLNAHGWRELALLVGDAFPFCCLKAVEGAILLADLAVIIKKLARHLSET
ncbi:hypothetical protein [Paraburkholderia saeva]|uniref:hypothetical protein n=1 Tax=Paraburkholderia saeva TaxID=2777537 RepID=UPI001E2C0B01|nr:hypothetical protein [Paraburkholderia saeva]